MDTASIESCAVYVLSPGVDYREEEFGGILFFRPLLWFFEVNHSGLKLLAAMKENSSRHSTLGEVFGSSLEKCREFLEFMLEKGLIKEVSQDEQA